MQSDDLPPTERPRLRLPRNITDLLNYRLASLIASSGAAVIRVCEGRFGISRREWHVIGLLVAFGGKSPSELADLSHLDRSRVSRAISALAEKGLIKRSALQADQRRAKIELTPAGQELHGQMFEEISAINARLLEAFDDVQLFQLDRLLLQLKASADDVATHVATDVHANRRKGIRDRLRRFPGG
jgi:DNA-binding MarR family transcriptional regulator